ncbi:MAG TPA: CoA-binding protein, partial [Ilumatobacteraceae bacterium]
MTVRSLFWPASVVVVGASSNPDAPGGKLFEMLRDHGFAGSLYAVNPRGGEISPGVEAYVDLESLPEVPELCLIVVAADRVMPVLESCQRLGVSAALVYSAEPTEEHLTHAAFDAVTTGTELRILGPNSVGLLNVGHHLAATWSPAIDARRGGRPPADGAVAIVAQSGGLGFGLLSEAQRRGLGVRCTVSTGNEANLGCAEVASYLLDEESISVVLMFVEGLHAPIELVDLGRKARRCGKSVIVVKVGRSAAAQEASALHTAHLAGSDVAYDAVFQEYGISRAEDSEEMIDAAMALVRCPSMSGPRVGIATYSGGGGVWLADACSAAGLSIPALDADHQQRLAAQVGTFGSVRNPIDLTGPKLSPTALVDAAASLAESDAVDAVVIITPTIGREDSEGLAMDNGAKLANDLAALQARTGKPVVLFTYTGVTGTWLRDLSQAGIAWYTSPVRLANALHALVEAGERDRRWSLRATEDLRVTAASAAAPIPGSRSVLLEHEVKEMLRQQGAPTTREVLATSAEEAVREAAAMGGRVALKAQAAGIVHKMANGLVALDVAPGDIAAVFAEQWAQ